MNRKTKLFLAAWLSIGSLAAQAQEAVQAQTLEKCQQAAVRNYPLIRQYDLIAQTAELTVANVGKGWMPQVSATTQATLQSSVTAWPDEMRSMMRQMGIDVKGLKKDQYRVGIDVSQTVYDGGAIGSEQDVVRRQADVAAAQNEVTLYGVRQRVIEMYFALLLLDEQLRLNADLQGLLAASEKKLESMFRHGTAAESDYTAVKAERLSTVQQGISLQAQRQTLLRMLSLFCGIEVKAVVTPSVDDGKPFPASASMRPELQLTEAQLKLTDAQERALASLLKPRLGVFAQGYYGYPGYNMFEDMMHRRFSLNGMVGVRLTWNIGTLYTHKNDRAKLQLQRNQAEMRRDVFLFNNRLEQLQHDENIDRYRKMVAADEEIIALRQKVRLAAESKLVHGIIDVNDLLKEINSESTARVQRSMHEVEMLKEIYGLKYTLNQ